MPKPSKATAKAFAVASSIASVIKSNNTGEPELTALLVQCNRAMKVFNKMAGRKIYWEISNYIQKIWEKLSIEHRTVIEFDEVPIFIEYLCMLIPPNNFKNFLGVSPYTTSKKLLPEVDKRVVTITLELDKEFNDYFDTKSYTLSKPKEKTIKIKKERDKSKKTKQEQKKISASKRKEAERKKVARSFLRNKLAELKKDNE